MTFETLLSNADVLIDGYRSGALERLGYGPSRLRELALKRGKGIVYISESCYGPGQFYERPGWQPIADCVSGVAWAQGRFMGINEPVVPPFPMSDYGTGLMGAVTVLTALYQRATQGGSFHIEVALVKYNQLLYRLGTYPLHVQQAMRDRFAGPFFELTHTSHTDVVSWTALEAMKRETPELFSDDESFTETWWSDAYQAKVKVVKQVAQIEGLDTGYARATRPNGTDTPSWEGWEVEHPL
ncbi:hypothetical protein LTS14_000722 [Recurvomyces mirabilis]|nr:hypothetical protein LTS14_000722 [Recurvomyces mirabilis]